MARGIGRMGPLLGLAIAASLAEADRDVLYEPRRPSRHSPPPPINSERSRQRAYERRERKRREDELRERLLRQKIAEGKDDRDDKYLHSAARRRRQTPSPLATNTTGGA